ncbi:hypothetical protein ENBRE01_2390 [Enteropsectra breve]|nr:hypothetical protein ENBRE01_2390 [Enteropsectra breve]
MLLTGIRLLVCCIGKCLCISNSTGSSGTMNKEDDSMIENPSLPFESQSPNSLEINGSKERLTQLYMEKKDLVDQVEIAQTAHEQIMQKNKAKSSSSIPECEELYSLKNQSSCQGGRSSSNDSNQSGNGKNRSNDDFSVMIGKVRKYLADLNRKIAVIDEAIENERKKKNSN